MKCPLFAVLHEMELRGGSFVVALALAARKADPENLARLLNAFPEIFDRYDALASAVPIPTDFGPSDNAGGMARGLAAPDSESPHEIDG